MITGLDLVELQLRIAAGEKLHLTQSKIRQSGHAIEARIYAENPETGFLPSTGKLQGLVFPASGQSEQATAHEAGSLSSSFVRIDTGVEEGDQISIDYDPLMAKMIVHADTRKKAIKAMRYALAQTAVLGVETNLGFLQSIFLDGNFEKSQQDTLFVDSRLDFLLVQEKCAADWVYWISAVYCFLVDLAQAEKNALYSLDPSSPWNRKNSWRAVGHEPYRVHLRNQKGEISEILIAANGNSFQILNITEQISVSISQIGNLLELNWSDGDKNGFGSQLLVLHHENQLVAVHEHGRAYFRRIDPLFFEKQTEKGEFRLSAPMPGNVIRVFVKSGERVSRGQQLLVMEAMKMEHAIVAPVDGVVEKVLFNPGDLVQNGSELIEFTQLESTEERI